MEAVEREEIETAAATERARRASGVFPAGGASAAPRPAPAPEVEVVAKAERRRFTAEYKRRIVREADRCTRPGEIGALLRREGLYSSLLTTWRAARDRGELEGLSAKKRGTRRSPSWSVRSVARASAPSVPRRWSMSKKNSRRCWGPRSRARNDDRDGARGGAAAGDRADVRGAGAAAGNLLPADQFEAATSPTSSEPPPPA